MTGGELVEDDELVEEVYLDEKLTINDKWTQAYIFLKENISTTTKVKAILPFM